jgi:hypothetical protein
MKTLLHIVNPSRARHPTQCPELAGNEGLSLSELVSIGSYRLVERIEDAARWLRAWLRAGRSA